MSDGDLRMIAAILIVGPSTASGSCVNLRTYSANYSYKDALTFQSVLIISTRQMDLMTRGFGIPRIIKDHASAVIARRGTR